MGSAAMDGSGDLAVGFSASSATINPRSATQAAGDRPVEYALAQGEARSSPALAAKPAPAVDGAITAP
jgi:hypothetical protein